MAQFDDEFAANLAKLVADGKATPLEAERLVNALARLRAGVATTRSGADNGPQRR